MGYSHWSSNAYADLTKTYETKTRAEIFTNSSIPKDMDPNGLKFRECRDSKTHPESLAVAIFLDVTGSMGKIPEAIVRKDLGTLMDSLIKHDVKDAAVLFGAIGDQFSDRAPLQVGQFESGEKELTKWLTQAWLEGHGGGQHYESYPLAWLTAAKHTAIDCFEKRKQKGVLFTIGDEAPWATIGAQIQKDIFGAKQAETLTAKDILAEAKKFYHVFHIHINEASYKNDPKVLDPWRDLLGERLIILDDHTKLAQIIATTVAVIHGTDIDQVIKSFDKSTSSTVRKALANISPDAIVKKAPEKVLSL